MPANIDTAVLPLGGRGTRMLPLTKAIPKEMLPVFDAPVIWKIATELGSSGVRRLVLVVPPGPSITADFFARDAALEKDLRSKGAGEVADMMAQIGRQFAVEVARQPQPKGDGDALLRGAQLAGADECFVYFGDELLHGGNGFWKPIIGPSPAWHSQFGRVGGAARRAVAVWYCGAKKSCRC